MKKYIYLFCTINIILIASIIFYLKHPNNNETLSIQKSKNISQQDKEKIKYFKPPNDRNIGVRYGENLKSDIAPDEPLEIQNLIREAQKNIKENGELLKKAKNPYTLLDENINKYTPGTKDYKGNQAFYQYYDKRIHHKNYQWGMVLKIILGILVILYCIKTTYKTIKEKITKKSIANFNIQDFKNPLKINLPLNESLILTTRYFFKSFMPHIQDIDYQILAYSILKKDQDSLERLYLEKDNFIQIQNYQESFFYRLYCIISKTQENHKTPEKFLEIEKNNKIETWERENENPFLYQETIFNNEKLQAFVHKTYFYKNKKFPNDYLIIDFFKNNEKKEEKIICVGRNIKKNTIFKRKNPIKEI